MLDALLHLSAVMRELKITVFSFLFVSQEGARERELTGGSREVLTHSDVAVAADCLQHSNCTEERQLRGMGRAQRILHSF